MGKFIIWHDQVGNSFKYASLGVDNKDTQIQLGIVSELLNSSFRVESSYVNSQPTFTSLEETERYLLQIASEYIP
jgi:hypothetical protein